MMKQVIKWSITLTFLLVLAAMVIYIYDSHKTIADRTKTDEYFTIAQQKADDGYNREAIRYALTALRTSPRHTDVLIFLSGNYLVLHEWDSARVYGLRSLKEDPDNIDALTDVINAYFNAHDYRNTLYYIALYHIYHEQEQNRDILIKQYYAQTETGNTVESEKTYRSLLSFYPADANISTLDMNYYEPVAWKWQKKGNTDSAIYYYEHSLRHNGNDTAILQQLINLYASVKKYNEAIEHNSRILLLYPYSSRHLLDQAGFALSAGNTKNAVYYAEKAYAHNTTEKYKTSLVDIYLVAAKQSRPADRIEYAKRAIAINKQQREAYQYIINGYNQSRNYTAAVNYINVAFTYWPNDPDLIRKKAGILTTAGNTETANAFMDSVMTRSGNGPYKAIYAALKTKYAALLISRGRYGLALAEIQKGLRYQPEDHDLSDQLVTAYLLNKKTADALRANDVLISDAPDNQSYAFRKVGILETLNRYEDAAAQAMNLYNRYHNSNYLEAYKNDMLKLASGSIRNNNITLSIAYSRKVLSVDKNNYDALLYLSNAYYIDSSKKHALAVLDTALMTYTSDSLLLSKKSGLLAEMGNLTESLVIMEGLRGQYPADHELDNNYVEELNALGKSYERKGDLDSAMIVFKKSFAVKPVDTFATQNLAALHLISRQFDSAVYYSDKGLLADPRNEYLLLKKITAYDSLKNYMAAYQSAKTLHTIKPDNSYYRNYGDDLHSRTYKNRIGISQEALFFPGSFQPRSITGVQYSRIIHKTILTGYLNYLTQPGGQAIQFGADVLYSNNKTAYSELFVFKGNDLFPQWRTGYSLFKSFRKGWTGEAGARYLGLDSINDFSVIAAVGKYLNDRFWLNGKLIYTSDTHHFFQSYQLAARKYLNDKLDYITVSAGTGSTPEDQSLNYKFISFNTFVSRYISAGLHTTFRYKTTLDFSAGMNRITYTPSVTRTQLDFSLSLIRSF